MIYGEGRCFPPRRIVYLREQTTRSAVTNTGQTQVEQPKEVPRDLKHRARRRCRYEDHLSRHEQNAKSFQMLSRYGGEENAARRGVIGRSPIPVLNRPVVASEHCPFVDVLPVLGLQPARTHAEVVEGIEDLVDVPYKRVEYSRLTGRHVRGGAHDP